MGQIEDFLGRVVPWPAGPQAAGLINLHWTSPKGPGMRGRPYTSVTDLLSMAQWGATKPSVMKDIYFCLSSQKAAGKVIRGTATALRNSQNVHRVKALWMDIDVKPDKGYATTIEAIDALTVFCETTNIPFPTALVFSGSGGFHVYWISDKALTQEEWRPYAEGLEALAKAQGLRRDAGLTTDIVRVLRVPGTFNYKTVPPTAVRLAGLVPTDINFEKAFGHIKVIPTGVTTPVTAPADLCYDPAVFPARTPIRGPDTLAAGVYVHEDTPLDYAEVIKNCPHFQETACVSHGRDNPQGLWMLDVLASTFMQDARGVAHILSRGYKTYTAEETDRMFDRKLAERAEKGFGWPSCDAFEGAGCKECATCPFKGKIRSPLNLAIRTSAPIHSIATAALPPDDMCLPEGFAIDKKGYICAIIQEQVGTTNETRDVYAPMFRCLLTNPSPQGGKQRSLRLEAQLDKDTVKAVVLKEEFMGTEQMLIKGLWALGIKTYVEHEKRIRPFMSAWLQKLDDMKKRLNTLPFGWLIEKGSQIGFAYNGTVYRKDGKDHPAGVADVTLQAAYTPEGTIAPWLEAMKLITDQHRPDLEVIAAIGFASPLLFVAGQYSGVVVGWSPAGGVHKSTALRTGLAVWANPKQSKEVPSVSDNGLFGKLSNLRNLPMMWDELADDKSIGKVVGVVGAITEGIDGSKMTQDRQQRERKEWQALVGICANQSIWDEAIKRTKATDSQLRRIFEFKVEPKKDTQRSSDVSRLIESLDYNYGWAGVVYAEYLGRDPQRILDDTKKILNMFEDDIGVQSNERFWTAVCATVIAGAQFANMSCGVHFNVGEIYNYLKGKFMEHRDRIKQHAVVGGSSLNVSDILTAFFKQYTNNRIWIDKKPVGRGKQTFKVIHQTDPLHPQAVHIQWVRDDRVLRISQSKFEAFIAENNYGFTSVMDGLRTHYNATVGITRVNLSAWTGQGGGPETIIEIPIPPGHDLEEIMYQYTPITERPANFGMRDPALAQADADLAAVMALEEKTTGEGPPAAE